MAGSPVERLAPMTALRVLDTAVDVVRFRSGRILGLSAVVVVPVVVVPNMLASRVDGADATSGPGNLSLVVGALTMSLATALVGVPLGTLVSRWSVGEDPGFRDALRVMVGRIGAVVAAFVLGCLAKAVLSAMCGLGWLVGAAFLMVVSPMIAAEGCGPIQAMKRSMSLCARRWLPLLGIVVVQGLLSLTVMPALFAGTVEAASSESVWTSVVAAGALYLPLAVWIPFVAATSALAYLDLRVRYEALDLQLEMGRAFPGAPGR